MKISVKAMMIATLFIASMLAMPIMAFAQDDSSSTDTKQDNYGMYKNFSGGFGGIFSDNMGYGGQLLGAVFETLLLQSLDLENSEMTEGVYVLSASQEETFNGSRTFAEDGNSETISMLPWFDKNDNGNNDYTWNYANGYPYCEITREGGFDYNLTIGVAITLIIWDNDGSFITAAQKLIDFAQKYSEETDGGKTDPSEELVSEGISVLTWVLVHINEIFTGDELFVLNPITWQTLELTTSTDFEITKTWKYTGNDWNIDPSDQEVETDFAGTLDGWNDTANNYKDSYMEWLLRDFNEAGIFETLWTQFSFDLAQLWIKTFHIEIDMAEITNAIGGEDVNVADAFSGCDIEFYLFTHHLGGVFLYNDNNSDDVVSVTYGPLVNESAAVDPETGKKPYLKNSDDTDMMLPNASEITHQVILGGVEDFDFNAPEANDDGDVEWGITLDKPTIVPVPVGVDLNSYLGADDAKLDYIDFGLKLVRDIGEPDSDGNIEASASVKLQHNLAPWTDFDTSAITGLDLTIVYVSAILHFHLEIDNKKEDPEDPETILDPDDDYENGSESIQVGNYLDEEGDKLDFVDIAGENYMLGNTYETANEYTPTTAVVPIALWEGQAQAQKTNTGESDTNTDDFQSDISVEASFNVMFYAVCYPDFNGTGMGIWHDPTFSVYMVFTPEASGFWAIILLVAGLGLMGVATILIKRRKDKRI